MQLIRNTDSDILADSTKLKISMIVKFIVIACVFFIVRLTIEGIFPAFAGSSDSIRRFISIFSETF